MSRAAALLIGSFTAAVCWGTSGAESEGPERALALLCAAQGQVALGGPRAQSVADEELAGDDELAWRARLVQVEASATNRPVPLLDRLAVVRELEAWLAHEGLGDPDLRLRTLMVIGRLSEGATREQAYLRAVRLAMSQPVTEIGRFAPILKAVEQARTDGSGCIVVSRGVPPAILLELDARPLDEVDRAEWWHQIVLSFTSPEDAADREAQTALHRLVDERIQRSPESVPPSVLVAIARSRLPHSDPSVPDLLERAARDPRATEVDRRAAARLSDALQKFRVGLAVGPAVPAGSAVEVNVWTRYVDEVTLRVVPLALASEVAPANLLPGCQPSGPVLLERRVAVPPGRPPAPVNLGPLPLGAWRVEGTAAGAHAQVDLVVTDALWVAWDDADRLELAVVEPAGGRPLAGVPVRVGSVTGDRLTWWSDATVTDSRGRTSVLRVGDSPRGFTQRVVAIQRGGRWLPWVVPSWQPRKPFREDAPSCRDSLFWLQLVVQSDRLIPAVPFRWQMLLDGHDDVACLPATLEWSVYANSRSEPLARGTAAVSADGRSVGEVVPGNDWPGGRYEIVIRPTQRKLGLLGKWWQLGRLQRIDETPPGIDLEVAFSPLGRQVPEVETLTVEVAGQGRAAPGRQVRLVVLESERFPRDSARLPVLVSLALDPESRRLPSFDEQPQPRLLADSIVTLGESGRAVVELPWPEHASTALVASATPVDGDGLQPAVAGVVVEDPRWLRTVTMCHHDEVGLEGAAEPVVVAARAVDRTPDASAPLRLELLEGSSRPDTVPTDSVPFTTDGSGLAVIDVAAFGETSLRVVDEAGTVGASGVLRDRWERPSTTAPVSLEFEPRVGEPGGEVQAVVRSPGDGRLAILAVGRSAPVTLRLDEAETRIPVRVPTSQVHGVLAELSSVVAGRPDRTTRSLPLRTPLLAPWDMRRLTARVDSEVLLLEATPPAPGAAVLALGGPVLWPPLPPERLAAGARRQESPPTGALHYCRIELPARSSSLPSPADAVPSPTISTAAKVRPTPNPTPSTRVVIPVRVAPLAPARLLCSTDRVDLGESASAVCPGLSGPVTAVVVSPGESPGAHRYVVPSTTGGRGTEKGARHAVPP